MKLTSSTRPVIPGFYPDPSMCRVEDVYYLVTSTFEYSPGVRLWISDDLVHWKQVGNVLDRPELSEPGVAPPSGGIYAPTLRHYDGRFWMVTTDVRSGGGHFVVHTTNPMDPWSEPIRFRGIPGIDPDLSWDEKGLCLLTYCASGPGIRAIEQVAVDPWSGAILEKPHVIWRGTGMKWPEAPHLYHIADWWYLLIAEGGTEAGHSISVARSRSPRGPFVSCPSNPILTHRSTDHATQNVGHGDLVQCPDGSWALVYLGTRPQGITPGFHVLGREVFLAGVTWEDGWPVVHEDAYSIEPRDTAFFTGFDQKSEGEAVDPRWISPGLAPNQVGVIQSEGLVLESVIAENGSPSGWALRVRDLRWEARARVRVRSDFSPFLRLLVDDHHYCEVGMSGGQIHWKVQIGSLIQDESTPWHGQDDQAFLHLTAIDPTTGGPDDIRIGVSNSDGHYMQLARLDGRYFSTEVAGGFTGRVIAMMAREGKACFSAFEYRPTSFSH